METKDYLRYVVEEIHRTIVATVDDEGLPVTAAIDMMDYDDHSLYFLTAKGKNFYDRLSKRKYLAFTAMKGEDTLSSVAVSIRGKVREVGSTKLSDLFQKNPYMEKIYPTEKSREALTVFRIYEGSGEWFDLSKRPIERASFTFGDPSFKEKGFFITDACIGCGQCTEVCPQNCICSDSVPMVIEQTHCLHCGNCLAICPIHAIERR